MKIKKEELGMAQFFQKILSMVKTEKTHRYSAWDFNQVGGGPNDGRPRRIHCAMSAVHATNKFSIPFLVVRLSCT